MEQHLKPMKRPDGRWIVVYGPEMLREGEQCPGTTDYDTQEEAVAAMRDELSNDGERQQDTSYDKYMLDTEPELEVDDAETAEEEPEEEAEDEDEELPTKPDGMLPMHTLGKLLEFIGALLQQKGLLTEEAEDKE